MTTDPFGAVILVAATVAPVAYENGIHPSIVLGRLQKVGYVEYSQYQELKISYNIIINGNLI